MGEDDRKRDGEARRKAGEAGAARLRRLRVADLFAGDREVILEHGGQDFRLRITANGKLILTK